VTEILISEPMDKNLSPAQLQDKAASMYTKIVAQNDAKKKGALFDSKITHVGIQCGCHISKEDYCCFSYGVNVKEKSGVETLGVLHVEKATCDDSSESWHKAVKGENFVL